MPAGKGLAIAVHCREGKVLVALLLRGSIIVRLSFRNPPCCSHAQSGSRDGGAQKD